MHVGQFSSLLSCCTCSLLLHITELKQWYHAAVVPAMATCGCELWDTLTTNLRWVFSASNVKADVVPTHIHTQSQEHRLGQHCSIS